MYQYFRKKDFYFIILYLIVNRINKELLNVYNFNAISLYRLHYITLLYQSYYRA